MATSQGFNKPRISYNKVNRRKRQEKAKLTGKADKGQALKVAVSGVRTKKHAKKVAHRQRMLERYEREQAAKAEQEQQEQQEQAQKQPEVKMSKARKAGGKKRQGNKAVATAEQQDMQE